VSELFLFDDAVARTFEPFALTRPISELRAGALLLRERWERAFQRRAAGAIAASHLADFDEPWAARPLGTRLTLPAGSILANSRCAVSLVPQKPVDAKVWHCDGRVAAIALAREVSVDELRAGRFTLESLATAGSSPHDIGGQWIHRDGCRFSYVEAPETCEVLAAVLAEVARQDAEGSWPPIHKGPVEFNVFHAAQHIREAKRLRTEGA